MISQLHEALSAKLDTSETLCWFRSIYLPEMIAKLNTDESRRSMALYEGEEIRTNERNLADTRSRVGTLLEYTFARISNDILKNERIDDLYWTYVVSNRFPDLEVHSSDGETMIRIEMKALESRAEEKSANFATLIKDISPNTDYLIVCLWQWNGGNHVNAGWESAVYVKKIYVFHAYSLARIRDFNWLNSPPSNCKAYQGIDIRTAINCNDKEFSVEEHNMGKLLRLWQGDMTTIPDNFSKLEHDTLASYLQFVDEVYEEGYKVLSDEILKSIGGSNVNWYVLDGVSYPVSEGVTVVPNGKARTKKERMQIGSDSGASIIIRLGRNYQCSAWRVIPSIEYDEKVFDKIKPKNVRQKLKKAVVGH